MDDRDAMLCFVVAEFVVGIDKHRHDSDQRFKPATKTAYPASQNRQVVPQIGVDPFDSKGVVFVVNVSHVLARINHIDVAQISVRAVFRRRRRGIDNALNALRRLVERDRKPTIWRGSRLTIVIR